MNAFVVAVSAVLMIYWFRYTCLLVLRANTARSYERQIADANQLSFLNVKAQLAERGHLVQRDQLQAMLDRDYQLLTFLLRNGSNFRMAGPELEHVLLHLDYRLMRMSYHVARMFSFYEGRRALAEMADIVGHLANSMGERAAQAAAQ